MKKLAVLILTVFTMATVVVCGCGESKKTVSFDNNAKTERVQIQEIEEIQEGEQVKPECPDCEKRDGECPAPRKPHKRHDRKLPQPKPAQSK